MERVRKLDRGTFDNSLTNHKKTYSYSYIYPIIQCYSTLRVKKHISFASLPVMNVINTQMQGIQ